MSALPMGEPVRLAGELQFRSLLEKLPAGAYTCDPDGLITYYNDQAVQIWGREPELNDPVDRWCGSFRLFCSDGSPMTHDECSMAQSLKNNLAFNGHEVVIERPDGRRLTALAHANPIHDESGQLIGAVNVLVDITERKRVENALKDADRSKNEFIATLAHELRNPLAPMRNAVEVLHLKRPPVPELQWALEVIDRQMHQMTRLIDDLLDLARVTGNKLELQKSRIDLTEVLQAAVETSRPSIESCGHELSVDTPSEPVVFDGDLTRLAQVVSNLLNNAAKYTPRGGRIWLEALRDGSEAVLTVRDTGIGIRPEMLPKIFEMFTQADLSLDRSQGGLGIGLTLARRLVEMHGGSIVARSAGPGEGSAFIVRLPLTGDRPKTVEPPAPAAVAETASLSLRILVVDDYRDAADGFGMLLRLLGNDVRTANDGLEALRVASQFRPDVVLLDIGLPGMSGYDVAREIRKEPWGETVLLVAVTGWGQEGDRRRSKEAGFDHHLVKPVDPAALMRLLEARFSARDQRAGTVN
ncbi:MAG: ATP-binding protein [Thermoanaerobaculia bacterium]